MMTLFFRLSMGVMLLTLTGCGLFQRKPEPPITKYVVVQPPAEMVQDCDYAVPPLPGAYAVATDTEKEVILYTFSLASLDNTKKCNVRWDALRQWYVKQNKIYSEKKE